MAPRTGAQPTALGVSVLALLSERPMHPYEMYQLLTTRREDVLVKVRPGSLYHTVARLAEQDLVRAEGVDRAGRRPERTTYRITDAGARALHDRLSEVLRFPHREYPVFPLALAESHHLPAEEVAALLRERRDHLRLDLDDLDRQAEWATTHRVPRRYWLAVPYLRTTLGAELAWITDFLAELESGALEWERFDPVTGRRADGPEHPWADTGLPPVPRRHATRPTGPGTSTRTAHTSR